MAGGQCDQLAIFQKIIKFVGPAKWKLWWAKRGYKICQTPVSECMVGDSKKYLTQGF